MSQVAIYRKSKQILKELYCIKLWAQYDNVTDPHTPG
jgi:hypothetical protein